MKVLPISFRTNSYNNNKFNKIEPQSITDKGFHIPHSPAPNFTGIDKIIVTPKYINSLDGFKALSQKRHLSCIWCGKPMLHTEEMDYFIKLLNQYTPNGDNFTKIMQRLQDYFPPKSELSKFTKRIAAYNSAYPNQSLKHLIYKMQPEAEKKLVNKQSFVFQKLEKLACKLPQEQRMAFESLMANSKKRIYHIPYVSEYSAKEFAYQLDNLTKSLKGTPVYNKIQNIKNYLTCDTLTTQKSEKCPQKFINNLALQFPLQQNTKEQIKRMNYPEWQTQLRLLLLNEIKDTAEKILRPDIKKLCQTTQDKALGIPTTVQFSNKAFIYKLNEILDKINNEPLKNELNKTAEHLPSSFDNIDAFIIKHKYASEETILNNILRLIQGTLEHIVPILRHTNSTDLKAQIEGIRRQKGKNEIENWALAHSWCNTLHGSRDIKGENFPFDKGAGEKYFQTLIQEANNGHFAGKTIIQMAKNYFTETGIKINLKGLKYSEEY